MNGIKSFEDHLNALIAHAKANTSISHMTDEEGKPASWNSKVWIYTNDKHQTANFLFTAETKAGAKLGFYKNVEPMPSPMREVIMLYALHIIGRKTGTVNKRTYVATARQALEGISSIEDLNLHRFKALVKEKSNSFVVMINDFINFLNDTVFHLDPLRRLNNSKATQTGDEVEIALKDKLPDEKCIAALGAILYNVIPHNESLWNIGPLESQREAFACTMSALAIGSPNRAVAEQTVLDAQRLKKHTEKVGNKEEVVHYLNWKGSKGYKNNQNHILSVISACVERCLDYTLKATEPMRALSRFYVEPQLPLKSILSKESCDVERWQQVNPDLDKPTNMVTLGYLLGLYSEGATIQVIKGTEGAQKENPDSRNSAWCKPVWMIKEDDILKISKTSVADFIGLKRIGGRAAIFDALGVSGKVPLQEVQKAWISHIKKIHPAFPVMRNQTKEGCCDVRTMLFALSGLQLRSGGGSDTPGANSNFFPVSPSTLGTIFYAEISKADSKNGNIFTKNGFSEEFYITPHQFRHYIDHTAFESGVPKLIINLWSGRKDPTQVLHYIHTSDADQASIVSDIMFNEDTLDIETAKTRIRLHSLEEYNELTNSAASETSSGVCTQALHITPCEYLNDFDTQCLFCEKSCHVAHDDQAIELLNNDLKHQQRRLEQVSESSRFVVSQASQKWYKVHRKHTEMLTQLLALMSDESIRKGSLIRLLSTQSEFRITDLKTKKVEIKQLCLPDVEKEITQLISEKNADDNNDVMNELLELI